MRETQEETGITCEITGISGTYTDPKHVIHYTSDDEVRQEFSIVLTALPVSGEVKPSSESREVRWIPKAELEGYRMDRSMKLRLSHYVEGRARPYIE